MYWDVPKSLDLFVPLQDEVSLNLVDIRRITVTANANKSRRLCNRLQESL